MRTLRRRWFPWAVYGGMLLSLGPLALLAYAFGPREGDLGINCGGIGFGETPCGWDAVGLLLVLVAIPYMIGYAAALGLSEIFGSRFTFARSWLAIVGAAIPWGLAAYALVTS